jgi:hypothetical protein
VEAWVILQVEARDLHPLHPHQLQNLLAALPKVMPHAKDQGQVVPETKELQVVAEEVAVASETAIAMA